jgi:hypothetical protein
VGRNLIKLAKKMKEIPVGYQDEQSMGSQVLSTRPATAKPPFGATIASGEDRTRHREGFFSWMVVWALGYLGLWDWAGARTIATGII